MLFSKPPVIRQGRICMFAQADVTCFILRGSSGDLLIDTGLPQIRKTLLEWLASYQVRWVFLTHAHPDHDWNAAFLQKQGAKLLLSERDRTLRRNFLSQRVMPTACRYRLRNVVQCIGGGIIKSPPYDADFYFGSKHSGLLRKFGFDAEIIPLPGHTYGSSGILSGGVLYCGDAFTMIFGKPDVTPHAVSPQLLCESMQKMLEIQPKWLACGHGMPVRFADAAPVMKQYLSAAEKHSVRRNSP